MDLNSANLVTRSGLMRTGSSSIESLYLLVTMPKIAFLMLSFLRVFMTSIRYCLLGKFFSL